MDSILQGLLELPGVTVGLVFDGAGQLVAERGHALYDRALCQHVSSALVKAVDSIQLEHSDWDAIAAQFADGQLLLRNLGGGSGGQSYVLAVVADGSLNASFATVAIRVAANKLKKAIQVGASAPPAATPATNRAPAAGSAASPPAAPRAPDPVLATSGLSWSKLSGTGASGIAVADAAASAFLTRCAKELARHVGPMAKVYVAEAIRRVSPDAPFSVARAGQLVEDLAGQIDNPRDRAGFQQSLAG